MHRFFARSFQKCFVTLIENHRSTALSIILLDAFPQPSAEAGFGDCLYIGSEGYRSDEIAGETNDGQVHRTLGKIVKHQPVKFEDAVNYSLKCRTEARDRKNIGKINVNMEGEKESFLVVIFDSVIKGTVSQASMSP